MNNYVTLPLMWRERPPYPPSCRSSQVALEVFTPQWVCAGPPVGPARSPSGLETPRSLGEGSVPCRWAIDRKDPQSLQLPGLLPDGQKKRPRFSVAGGTRPNSHTSTKSPEPSHRLGCRELPALVAAVNWLLAGGTVRAINTAPAGWCSTPGN